MSTSIQDTLTQSNIIYPMLTELSNPEMNVGIYNAELQPGIKQVRTLVALLRSLWERYESSYPPSAMV